LYFYRIHNNEVRIPLQVNPLPENPVLQTQVNDPGVFVQFAYVLQGAGVSEHSFLSKEKLHISEFFFSFIIFFKKKKIILPVQVKPSPVYPFLQVQVKEPTVLVQSPFTEHKFPTPSPLHSF